jgi:hypothetical protein
MPYKYRYVVVSKIQIKLLLVVLYLSTLLRTGIPYSVAGTRLKIVPVLVLSLQSELLVPYNTCTVQHLY